MSYLLPAWGNESNIILKSNSLVVLVLFHCGITFIVERLFFGVAFLVCVKAVLVHRVHV